MKTAIDKRGARMIYYNCHKQYADGGGFPLYREQEAESGDIMRETPIYKPDFLQAAAAALAALGETTKEEAAKIDDAEKRAIAWERGERYSKTGDEIQARLNNSELNSGTVTLEFDFDEMQDIEQALRAESYKVDYEAYLTGISAADTNNPDEFNAAQSKRIVLETQARALRGMADTVNEYADLYA